MEFVPLKYSYSEYEPLVDTDTMRIHHGGHYKAYTDNLNAALLDAERYAPAIASMSLVDVLQSIQSRDETLSMHKLPANVSTAIMNNGGGYLNHVLFFNQLRERPHLQSRDFASVSSISYLLKTLCRSWSRDVSGRHALP